MSAASDGNGGGKARSMPPDFSAEPLYQASLKLCGVVMDLEMKYPDEERESLYRGMRGAAVETGSLIASAYGKREGPGRTDLWERARSRLMECRHYVLVAHMRYVLDSKDVEAFDQVYFELLVRLSGLLDASLAEGPVPARGED